MFQKRNSRRVTLRDALLRLRATLAAIDDALALSDRSARAPIPATLRADLDVQKTLDQFEREHAELIRSALQARVAWEHEAQQAVDWERRRAVSVAKGSALLAKQAAVRQHEHAYHADQLEADMEAWERLVGDYSDIIQKLRARLAEPGH